jgi:hypothetical protein
VALALVASAAVGACESNGTDFDNLRFGQVGEIFVQLTTPLQIGTGELQQSITWSSSGPWFVTERIYYLDRLGDENVIQTRVDPDSYAVAYASVITQFNETEGLELFIPELDPSLQPECGVGRTEIFFVIRDSQREQEQSWTRCGAGSLAFLTTTNAGPDAAASRVIQATLLVREFTIGADFRSTYTGSVPFATLDRGEDSASNLTGSLVILDEPSWLDFWADHKSDDPLSTAPLVDFSRDQVIVGAVGRRLEAGDSVEVRKILQLEGGTVTEVVERIPGNFCSPLARTHTPFHIVIAPMTAQPMSFRTSAVEKVPCG